MNAGPAPDAYGRAVAGDRRASQSLDSYLVPAARELPSNAAYLAHLTVSAGDDGLVRLASNENTEPPSPRVRVALERSYDDANLSPPPVPRLRLALASRHAVGSGQVLVTAGSTEVIDATLRTFVRAGDEVVIPHPSWPVCRRRLQALEARIVEVPLAVDDESWHFDVGRILDALTPATKLVVVCTPNNPTGNAMPLDGLRRLADTGLPLLVDAAYSDFDGESDPTPLVHDFPNVVLTRTFSKAYCLAGLRVGYAVGDAGVLDHVDRFLVPGSSISSASLHAGLAALEDDAYHEHQVARIVGERERLLPALRGLGLRAWASRGNFVAIDASGHAGGAAGLAAAILAHGVVVRPLYDLVRISIGRREENDALLAAVAAVVGRV